MSAVLWWTKARGLLPDQINVGPLYIAGSMLSVTMSWTANKSIIMAIFHGLCSWLYVLYYALSYN